MSSPSRSLFSPGGPGGRAHSPAARQNHPAVVQRVVDHLGQTDPGVLRKLTPSVVELAATELQLNAADRCTLDLWISAPASHVSVDATTLLANEVRRQQDQRVFPWLAEEEAATRQVQSFLDEYVADKQAAFESLRTTFVSKAKNGHLGFLENLVGQYCLYSQDREYSSFLLMSLLLKCPKEQRVSIHNWMIASEMTRSQVEAYGRAIAVHKSILFPVHTSLASLNQSALDTTLASVSLPTPTLPTDDPFLSGVTGGGTLPLQQQQDGSWAVDVSPVEAACNALQAQITALQRQKTSLQRTQRQHAFSSGPRYRRPRGGGDAFDAIDELFGTTGAGAPPPIGVPSQTPAATAPPSTVSKKTQADTAHKSPPQPNSQQGGQQKRFW